MILKFLRPSASFGAVDYNSGKIDRNKGELASVRNFGMLMGLSDLRKQDYINYLSAWSARNRGVAQPQLHVAISAKGREYDKDELVQIAHQWLNEMGYGSNPYLLIYHKDTANNHIHIVSSRVGPEGKKVRDSFEHVRGYQKLHEIMGTAIPRNAETDVEGALLYNIGTRAQFEMLLERKGYKPRIAGQDYVIFKFGTLQHRMPLCKVDERIGRYEPKKDRLVQLRAIIRKYQRVYDPALHPVRDRKNHAGGLQAGYSSELTNMLAEKFGLEFRFHFRDDKPPYGYTLFDHAQRTAYKGGMLMPLSELVSAPAVNGYGTEENIPDVGSADHADNYSKKYAGAPIIDQKSETPSNFFLSDDVDDEAIHGMKRRRKRKARTNTR